MKKILIAAAVAATFVTPQAFAQAKNFEGFSLGAALNTNVNKLDIAIPSFGFSGSETRTSVNAGVNADYSFAVGESFVLGLGASIGLGEIEATNGTKFKDTTSFYLTPGVAVSQNLLLYGKVASISAKMENSGGSMNFSGMGYGAGLRYLSGKNVFFQAEYVQNKYDDKTDSFSTIKNQTSVLSFGLGYKF